MKTIALLLVACQAVSINRWDRNWDDSHPHPAYAADLDGFGDPVQAARRAAQLERGQSADKTNAANPAPRTGVSNTAHCDETL